MADRVISPMLRVSPTVQFALYTQTHAHGNVAYSATNYRGKYGWIGIIWILTGKIFIHIYAHTDAYGYCDIRITIVIKDRIMILCIMSIEMVIYTK